MNIVLPLEDAIAWIVRNTETDFSLSSMMETVFEPIKTRQLMYMLSYIYDVPYEHIRTLVREKSDGRIEV